MLSGSALLTGCNNVFLERGNFAIERYRLLPFVNASSIRGGKVRWAGTQIVNVFDKNGKIVKLSKFPRMGASPEKQEEASVTRKGQSI